MTVSHLVRRRWWDTAIPIVALAAFAAAAYGYALRMPFYGDDYPFLEKTRSASFGSLWTLADLGYHFYRPWSRELHFWLLQHLFGQREAAFHLVSLALWVAAMSLYFLLGRRLAGPRVATLAACGVASLTAWGLPAAWPSGAQDLWMLCLGLVAILAFAVGAPGWSAAALALALLSKETALVVPAVILLYALLIDRRTLRDAVRRTAPLWVVLLIWIAFHPMLGGRLLYQGAQLPVVGFRPLEVARGTLLTLFNLGSWPAPAHGWWTPAIAGLPATIALTALAAWGCLDGLRRPKHPSHERAPGRTSGRVAGFLGGWALLGWLPTLMPAVAWQPYYALLGALGAWLAIAAVLARSPVVAIAVVAALSVLRSGYADTPSNAWSNAWSQRVGAAFVGGTRGYLTGRFPSLPRHARLFFTGVPGGVALVSGSGNSPPLRVWYSDSTVQGALYSRFQARTPSQPPGPDLFFRFDAATGWVEVTRGAEDVALARQANPRWERDHDKLAATLARGGDWAGAAAEYSKLAAANPREPDFAFNAGLCHETLGDRPLAAEWYRRAAALPGADAEILEAPDAPRARVPERPRKP